jgi:hypothetical protein
VHDFPRLLTRAVASCFGNGVFHIPPSPFTRPLPQANLLVETWIRGDRIASNCPSDGYFVKNIESLSFPSQDFKETKVCMTLLLDSADFSLCFEISNMIPYLVILVAGP